MRSNAQNAREGAGTGGATTGGDNGRTGLGYEPELEKSQAVAYKEILGGTGFMYAAMFGLGSGRPYHQR